MKVLWFTHVPTSEMIRRAGHGNQMYRAHWTAQLLHHVSKASDIKLAVVTAFPGLRESQFSQGGVTYFTIPQPRRFPAFSMRAVDLKKCVAAIEKFQPDAIHIHGSERFYGMVKVTGKTDVPTLVSIQGLLKPCSLASNFFGALSPIEILESIRLIELPVGLGLMWQFIDIKRGARREAKILSAVEGIIGRTRWDRVHTRGYNSDAFYCHVGEILRPAFYRCQWSLERCERHTLIYTNAGHPRRGTENLLKAVALLQDEFPNIRLRLVGRVSTRSGYGRFIRRRVRKLGIVDRVDFLGSLNDKEIVRALLRTHVFAITSYIENSPNSLAEAMLVGMPCVASFVGGMSDMVRNRDTGLLYPVDDVPLLAHSIRKIFLNDALGCRLGGNARTVALKRHEPNAVVEELLAAYEKVLTSGKY